MTLHKLSIWFVIVSAMISLRATTLASDIEADIDVEPTDEQMKGCTDSDPNTWTSYGGSVGHSGCKPDNSTLRNVEMVWVFNSSSGPFDGLAIANGYIYVSVYSGYVLKISVSTGNELFVYRYQGSGYTSPVTVIQNGSFLVQSQDLHPPATSSVFLTVKYGEQWWLHSDGFPGAVFPYGMVNSESQQLTYYCGGTDNLHIYAVDTNTGKSKFDTLLRNSTGNGCDKWGITVYNDRRVFFSLCPGSETDEGALFGEINPTTGSIIWTYSFKSLNEKGTYWTPIVYNGIGVGVAFSHSSSGVTAVSLIGININTHRPLWKTGQCIWTGTDSTPATDGTYVYLICNDGIYAYRLSDGKRGPKFDSCENCFGQPIVTARYLLAKSSSGIRVFNKSKGKLMARFLENVKIDTFSYQSGIVYATSGRSLYAYRGTD